MEIMDTSQYSIPVEIKEMMFMYLDIKSVISLHLVSRETRNICNSDRFWEFLLKRDFQHIATSTDASPCYLTKLYCANNSTALPPRSKYICRHVSELNDRFVAYLLHPIIIGLAYCDTQYIFATIDDKICRIIDEYINKLYRDTEHLQNSYFMTALAKSIYLLGASATCDNSRLIVKNQIIFHKVHATIRNRMIQNLCSLFNTKSTEQIKTSLGTIWAGLLQSPNYMFTIFYYSIESALLSSGDRPKIWKWYIKRISPNVGWLLSIWCQLHDKQYYESAGEIANYLQKNTDQLRQKLIDTNDWNKRDRIIELLSIYGAIL